jgi:hypothetical protein
LYSICHLWNPTSDYPMLIGFFPSQYTLLYNSLSLSSSQKRASFFKSTFLKKKKKKIWTLLNNYVGKLELAPCSAQRQKVLLSLVLVVFVCFQRPPKPDKKVRLTFSLENPSKLHCYLNTFVSFGHYKSGGKFFV